MLHAWRPLIGLEKAQTLAISEGAISICAQIHKNIMQAVDVWFS